MGSLFAGEQVDYAGIDANQERRRVSGFDVGKEYFSVRCQPRAQSNSSRKTIESVQIYAMLSIDFMSEMAFPPLSEASQASR